MVISQKYVTILEYMFWKPQMLLSLLIKLLCS